MNTIFVPIAFIVLITSPRLALAQVTLPDPEVANAQLRSIVPPAEANTPSVEEHATTGQPDRPRQLLPQRINPADIPPGYEIVEGDMLQRIGRRFHNRVAIADVDFWPGGIVPWNVSTTLTQGQDAAARIAMAQNAMNLISSVANVTFRPATGSDDDFITFYPNTANFSAVGRQGGQQLINIVNWDNRAIIAHELLHALGFRHEQSRPDRGNYVAINPLAVCSCCGCDDNGNNCGSCTHNFDIDPDATSWGSYDFGSVMHYGQYDFSISPGVIRTIIVQSPYAAEWQERIGQRDHLSDMDKLGVRGVYPFSGDRWYDQNATFSFAGSFDSPYSTSLATAALLSPVNATLFIKNSGRVAAVGTYARPMTIIAPLGATLGN